MFNVFSSLSCRIFVKISHWKNKVFLILLKCHLLPFLSVSFLWCTMGVLRFYQKMKYLNIQGVSKGSLQNFRGLGHITRIQNCVGTNIPKRHLNPLRTMCFRQFLRDVGVAFEWWIFRKHFYVYMVTQNISYP